MYKCDETFSNGSHAGDDPSTIYDSLFLLCIGQYFRIHGRIHFMWMNEDPRWPEQKLSPFSTPVLSKTGLSLCGALVDG